MKEKEHWNMTNSIFIYAMKLRTEMANKKKDGIRQIILQLFSKAQQ